MSTDRQVCLIAIDCILSFIDEYTESLINSYTLTSVNHNWCLDDLCIVPLNMYSLHMIYTWVFICAVKLALNSV